MPPRARQQTWTERLRVRGDLSDPLVVGRELLPGHPQPSTADLERRRDYIDDTLKAHVPRYKQAMEDMTRDLAGASDRRFESVGTTAGPSINKGYTLIRLLGERIDVAYAERSADDRIIEHLTQTGRALKKDHLRLQEMHAKTCEELHKAWEEVKKTLLEQNQMLQAQVSTAKKLVDQADSIQDAETEATKRNAMIFELAQRLKTSEEECARLRSTSIAEKVRKLTLEEEDDTTAVDATLE